MGLYWYWRRWYDLVMVEMAKKLYLDCESYLCVSGLQCRQLSDKLTF